jgi:hypothetical protein
MTWSQGLRLIPVPPMTAVFFALHTVGPPMNPWLEAQGRATCLGIGEPARPAMGRRRWFAVSLIIDPVLATAADLLIPG